MPEHRSATDIAADEYQSFDHLTTVVQPFETEGSRDVEFQQRINKDLLDLVLEFHAWAASKPTHEHEKATELLEKEVNFIIEKEKTQEQTRAMLLGFIKSVRSALATLGETL